MCRWLLAFQERRKVGLYLSDVSGAFDRVERRRLLCKLRCASVSEQFMKLFRDFLDVRTAIVIVGGAASTPFEI